MKKRMLCVILAGVLSCGVIGCGSDSIGTGSANAEDSADAGSADAESDGASDEETEDELAISDTVLWFNGTWAILGGINDFDYETYPGIEINQTNKVLQQESLKQSWSIYDTEDAIENMTWLMEEGGHREQFTDDMKYFEDNGIGDAADGAYKDWLLENFDMDEEEAASYADAYEFYLANPQNGIAAWDYSRAMSLCAFYNIAGYYTEEEALDKSMEIAKQIQSEFSSWDEFYESYFAGYEYWAGESSEGRRTIYKGIQYDEHSPFNLDWNLTFEKTW